MADIQPSNDNKRILRQPIHEPGEKRHGALKSAHDFAIAWIDSSSASKRHRARALPEAIPKEALINSEPVKY